MLALSLCVLFSVFSSSSVLGLTLKSHRCIAVSVPACVLPTDDTVFHRLLCFFLFFFYFSLGQLCFSFFLWMGLLDAHPPTPCGCAPLIYTHKQQQ